MERNRYDTLLEKQRVYYRTDVTKNIEFRKKQLKRLRASILKKKEDIVQALYKDLGKGEFETYSCEIMGILNEITLQIKQLRKWAKPEKVRTPYILFKAKSYVYKEPYGSVLLLTAWNYPFYLGLLPLVDVLAAGNCCILKPSELAPESSRVLREMIEECFSEEYCAVVEGGVEETTELLKERFDFIMYTGGNRVAKIIAQAAAKYLTPTVLELGGKCPCIVDETGDMELIARRIAWGKFINAGQTCVAPDYVVVPEGRKQEFIKSMEKVLLNFYGKNPVQSKDYGRILHRKHFERLVHLMEGGQIALGGKCDADTLYISPTIMDSVSWKDTIMEEEIFGPILPVLTYRNLEDLIEHLKTMEKPLGLYLFTKKPQVEKKIVNALSFGGGCINGCMQQIANNYLPFGGVGNSGMGKYHGKEGFMTFSNKKALMKKSTKVDLKIIYPPYEKALGIMKKICR